MNFPNDCSYLIYSALGSTDLESFTIEEKHDGTNPTLSSVFSCIPSYDEDTSKENFEMRNRQVKENVF